MQKFLQLLIDHLDLDALKIGQFSDVIFLCGGQFADADTTPTSARDFFYRRIQETETELFERIFLAEKINTWFSDLVRARYIPEDLLTFEKHLSGLASFICLIVESPGSIAELGAFTSINQISEKLMVVISHDHEAQDSFISLGPISLLKEKFPKRDRVFVYPLKQVWDQDTETFRQTLDILEDIWGDFIQDLKKFDQENPKKVKFKKKMDGHVSLLIGDLVGLFSALRLREIKTILKSIEIDLEEPKLKGHLLILEKLQLVKKYRYRSVDYYVAIKENNFIEYNFKRAPPLLVDRKRFKVSSNENYRKEDRSRKFAIRKAREAYRGRAG